MCFGLVNTRWGPRAAGRSVLRISAPPRATVIRCYGAILSGGECAACLAGWRERPSPLSTASSVLPRRASQPATPTRTVARSPHSQTNKQTILPRCQLYRVCRLRGSPALPELEGLPLPLPLPLPMVPLAALSLGRWARAVYSYG